MFQSIRKLAGQLSSDFDQIPAERKELLQKLGQYIQLKYNENLPVHLVFICTHNSRRSIFGQIAAAVAAEYYNIDNVHVYSGGTESTSFHANAMLTLKNLGFKIESEDEDGINPIQKVGFGIKSDIKCFSKVFDHPVNPHYHFAAIMTCSEAEQNCPYVPGTDIRIGLTYEDPKISDGTPNQDEVYKKRFIQIATEMMYAFSIV